MKKNFYVDDGLRSVETPEAAISLVKDTKKLCEKGGFNLHKFISNQESVIDAIQIKIVRRISKTWALRRILYQSNGPLVSSGVSSQTLSSLEFNLRTNP